MASCEDAGYIHLAPLGRMVQIEAHAPAVNSRRVNAAFSGSIMNQPLSTFPGG